MTTDPKDLIAQADQIDWPEEVWLREREEHDNGVGMVVFSAHATVARWSGDKERDADFHRYVDSDWVASLEKYHTHQNEALKKLSDEAMQRRIAAEDALAAERARAEALKAENARLRTLIMQVRRDADEWCISRMTGNPQIEIQKAERMWQTIRRAWARVAPIEASAAADNTEGGAA